MEDSYWRALLGASHGATVWTGSPWPAIVAAFAYIGSWTKENLHYLLPYLGILIVQATRFLAHVESRLPCSPAWLLPGLAILALIPNGASSLQNSLQLQLTDTRTRAAEWIQQTIPNGTGTA
ncbi:MAG: hypothetical protein CME05_16225 [Gemmatimonadaceae bacterium]|nr:hypothetical protein [Gemmatimonadaceae bacterium]